MSSKSLRVPPTRSYLHITDAGTVDLDAEVDDTAVDAELDSMLAAESMDATDAAPAEAAPAEAAPAATTEPAAPLKRSRGSPQPPAEKPAAPSETAVPTYAHLEV